MKTKRTFKRLLALAICVMMFATLLPTTAMAALKTPALPKLSPNNSGIKVSWTAVSGAAMYGVYRKTGNGSWGCIKKTSSLNYTDTNVNSGVTYYYSIRCLDGGGKAASSYNKTGKAITFFVAPTLVDATSVSNGIRVRWDAVPGAPYYLVYRKDGGSWVKKAWVPNSSTSWTDTKVDPGVNYTYTVRVVTGQNGSALSGIDSTGVTTAFTGKVQVTDLSNTQTGVKITWSSLSGVDHYRVKRKFGSGDWETIYTGTGTTYTDDEVANNITYTYMVRGEDSANDPFGNYDSTGKSITYYAPPTLVDAVRENSGIKVTWEAVEGISNYCVYRKVNNVGEWKKLVFTPGTAGSAAGQLYYLDTTLPSGAEANYTVRCCNSNNEGVSSRDSVGVSTTSATWHEAPLLTGVACVKGGIKVTWQAVDGVTDYQILRKDSSHTSWDPITIVSGTTEYVDPDVASGGDVKVGERYTYTVACSDGTDMTSEYNPVGLSATYFLAPEMIAADCVKAGVRVTWKKTSGVNTYMVYRKTGSASWTELGAVTGTTFTDTDVKSAGHYNYAVACMVNGAVMSAHEDPGVDTYWYAAPTLTKISAGNNGMTITWEPVDGIGEYRVYYLEDDGSTLTVVSGGSSVTGTTFTDNNVTSGVRYTYAVRCISGGKVVSSYNTIAKFFYSAPVLSSISSTTKGVVKFTWKAVPGAPNYLVYRKLPTGSWQKVGTTKNVTYTDNTAVSGKTYYYTVRVVNNAGTGGLSGIDNTGLMIKVK